jgi:hypothetical protein
MGEWSYSSTQSEPQQWVEVNSQFNAPAASLNPSPTGTHLI